MSGPDKFHFAEAARWPLSIFNDSGHEIPAWGCVTIKPDDGGTINEDLAGELAYNVERPEGDEEAETLLLVGRSKIADQGYGRAAWGQAYALWTDTTPAVGDQFGPGEDSFSLVENSGGPFTCIGIVNEAGKVMSVMRTGSSGGSRLVKCTQTGGSNGDGDSPPTYTYTIKDFYTDEELATNQSPLWTRENGSFTPAEIGFGYRKEDGTWGLYECDEARTSDEFECEDAQVESIASHSGSYTLTADDETFHFYSGSGGHTFTLPAATTNVKRTIKNVGSASLTLARAGSDTIFAGTSGNTSITLAVGDSVTVVPSSSSVWSVV